MGTEYIVIKPKDVKEKWMICGFLGSETKSDFKVVSDIKDYADKEGNGEVVEEKESHRLPHHRNGDGNQVQNTTPFTNATDDIPPADNMPSSTTDNNDMDNARTDWLSNSEGRSTENVHQSGSPINALQMLKPKDEPIVEKFEWITLSDDEDAPSAPINAPSASRSSYNAPRVHQQYHNVGADDVSSHLQQLLTARADEDGLSMYDQLKSRSVLRNYDDDCPAPKRGRSKSRGRESSVHGVGVECQRCMQVMSQQYKYYYNAKEHAATHLKDLKRFECLICGYQSAPKQNMANHMRTKHKGAAQGVKDIELTPEQDKEFEDLVQECFPGVGPMV